MTVIPGKGYDASPLRRLVMGANYRDLWSTPIEAPILDLGAWAGGLTPVKKTGSGQTIGLRLRNGDGVEYNFRSVKKNGRGALSAAMRGSLFEEILQDRFSRGYPAASMIVTKLDEAAGVLHATPSLFVLPDDPILGEFRAEYAGLLGTIEEDAPRVEGSDALVDTWELFDTLRSDPTQTLDAREYLRARLMDVLVGDWDRHADQWQWARFTAPAGTRSWRPVPEDFDWAFSRAGGRLFSPLLRQVHHQLVEFGPEYPAMLNLTWQAKDLDRRILSRLDRSAWDSVTIDLTSRLTDEAIAAAVRAQPAPFLAKDDGKGLESALRNRRDHLPEAAAEFYALLAGEVDVHATDATETIDVEHEDGAVRVTIRPQSGAETFRRQFDAAETREVRVFLHQGGDSVDVLEGSSGIRVRIIREEGDKPVARDESFSPPARDVDKVVASQPINWGRQWKYWPLASYTSDWGLILGVRVERFRYGFRASPYRSLVRASAGYAVQERGGRAILVTERIGAVGPLGARLTIEGSQIEATRFYGFGNGSALMPKEQARVDQDLLDVHPQIIAGGRRLKIGVGPFLRLANTKQRPGTFVARTTPAGTGKLTLGGARGSIGWDGGVHAGKSGFSTRGSIDGTLAHSISGTRARFARTSAEAGLGVTIPIPVLRPTLAIRGGGAKLWGDFPFQEAAFVGGSTTVRGYHRQRFAGDAAVFGGSAAWLRLGRLDFLAADFGVTGVADAGRVFLTGESSRTWHWGAGGGVWFGIQGFATVNVVAVRSPERTAYYVYTGYGY